MKVRNCGFGKNFSKTVLSALVVFMAGAASIATNSQAETGIKELAKVNGNSITDLDLKGALGGMNEGQRESVLRDANSRRQILNSLIDQEVLVLEASKEKLDQDQEFKEAIAAYRKQYLANRVLQKNLSSKMTDSAAKKYYDANKRKFSTDQIHAQHILVSDEERAMELAKEAKKTGTDFQALAEKNSRDPSAKNNRGDLGFFGRDRMVPEFTEAAFAAKEGDIVGPVKTTYGYHVIKVIEKKLGKPLEFHEVELRVKNEMRQEIMQSYVSGLKKQAKIQVNDEAVNKM